LAEVVLRPAGAADAGFIRKLILEVGINPVGLDWRRFIIAVDETGKPVGCGQLKPHGKEVLELASLAVIPGQQGSGIGSAIAARLIESAPRPLYLMCQARLRSYYEKFGFRSLELEEMPRYYRRIKKVLQVYERFAGPDDTVLVMKLQ
jgi:N-acetylglutamate synthase-like GNAT family acetyltransferase